MTNLELARIFYEIANILQMRGVQWKPQAYRKAAKGIESLKEDVSEIYKKGGLKAIEEIPGVGENIAKKIVEYVKTGKVRKFEELVSKLPKHMPELMSIPGMGPKRASKLYHKLGVKTVGELEKAAKEGRIRKLAGFGEKSEKDILEGIARRGSEERRPLKDVLPVAKKLLARLCRITGVIRCDLGGSIRRKAPTIRDIDLIASSNSPEKVTAAFVKFPEVKKILAFGPTKASVYLKNGMNSDLRVVNDSQFGAALLYLTGSKNFNIRMRWFAMKKGFKLSEYGLFDRKTGKLVASKEEKDIFKALGMKWLPPEAEERK